MGIFAKGSQFPADVTADTPQNRYGDQLTKDTAAGDALGEAIAVVNATATSANTTTGEIIADIEALEGRVGALEVVSSSSGTGWQAWRINGVTTVTFTGITEGFTLPAGYRPVGTVHGSFSYAHDSVNARFNITRYGVVNFLGTIPNPVYGSATFVSSN